jgi:methyl-accepting chemotaxis protein WspA
VATYNISAVSAGVMGMDKFSEEVRRGMQEVQQVGGQLSEIIQQVQALAPRCEAVNEGMRAQATGAEQIIQMIIGRSLTPLNSSRTMGSVRRRDDNSRGKCRMSVGTAREILVAGACNQR